MNVILLKLRFHFDTLITVAISTEFSEVDQAL